MWIWFWDLRIRNQASERTNFFSYFTISQLSGSNWRPIEFKFSQVCYFMNMLRYTKWEDWSLTITYNQIVSSVVKQVRIQGGGREKIKKREKKRRRGGGRHKIYYPGYFLSKKLLITCRTCRSILVHCFILDYYYFTHRHCLMRNLTWIWACGKRVSQNEHQR